MKVILQKDVKGIGRKGQVLEVNDGFARNKLLPGKLAVLATTAGIGVIDKNAQMKKEAHIAHVAKQKARAAEIEGMTLHFQVKAGSKGEVFGSVSDKDIIEELRKYKVHDAKAVLSRPIKSVGMYPVSIDLGDGIHATVNVAVKEE